MLPSQLWEDVTTAWLIPPLSAAAYIHTQDHYTAHTYAHYSRNIQNNRNISVHTYHHQTLPQLNTGTMTDTRYNDNPVTSAREFQYCTPVVNKNNQYSYWTKSSAFYVVPKFPVVSNEFDCNGTFTF